MKNFLKYSLLAITFLFTVVSGHSQNNTAERIPDSLILYESDFKFTDGVFLDFESVRRNDPIPKSRIMSNYNYTDKNFFDRVLGAKKMYYYDNVGNKLEVKTDGIWGYSRNGFLYINIDGGYYRITLIGSICHFIAYKTYETYSNTYPYYNDYRYQTRTPATTNTTTEMQQFILDFRTGNILEYSAQGMEVILMSDPELHDEYMQLSKKKKKQLKFVYIRRFNERNPLYLIKK